MSSRNINNYTSYYEQSSFETIEQVTLAEDLKFKTFEDIDAKFFYKTITPKVDEKNEKAKADKRTGTSNYVTLTIPSHLLLSAVKPKTLTCGVDPTTGCLKPGLRGYNILYTKEITKGYYTLEKGTVFIVEMLGGSMRPERGRILAIVGEITVEE